MFASIGRALNFTRLAWWREGAEGAASAHEAGAKRRKPAEGKRRQSDVKRKQEASAGKERKQAVKPGKQEASAGKERKQAVKPRKQEVSAGKERKQAVKPGKQGGRAAAAAADAPSERDAECAMRPRVTFALSGELNNHLIQLANMLVYAESFHLRLVIPPRLWRSLLAYFETDELHRLFCVEPLAKPTPPPPPPPPRGRNLSSSLAPFVAPAALVRGQPESDARHAAAYAAILSRPRPAVVLALRRLWASLCGGTYPCAYSSVHLRHMDGECARRIRGLIRLGVARSDAACHMPPDYVREQLASRRCGTAALFVADDQQNRSDSLALHAAFAPVRQPRAQARSPLGVVVDLLMLVASEPECVVFNPCSTFTLNVRRAWVAQAFNLTPLPWQARWRRRPEHAAPPPPIRPWPDARRFDAAWPKASDPTARAEGETRFVRRHAPPPPPPACRGAQHTEGEWARLPLAPEHPPCCSADSGWHSPAAFCDGGQKATDGAWRGRRHFLSRLHGRGCFCGAATAAAALGWRPARCSLAPWSAQRFCALLGRRRLLFIGDSTMQQLAATVMNHVRWGYPWEAEEGGGGGGGGGGGAPCQTQLWFAPADTLVGRPMGNMNRGHHFAAWLRRLQPHVAVLGAGNHVYGDGNFTAMLEEVAASLGAFPNVSFLWRTASPAGCGDAPLRVKPRAHPTFWPTYAARLGVKHTYNYMDYERRDEQAAAFWAERRRRGLPSAALLDVSPLYYRVDAHVMRSAPPPPLSAKQRASGMPPRPRPLDCTHWCSPGPLTFVAQLLLHRMATGELELPPVV